MDPDGLENENRRFPRGNAGLVISKARDQQAPARLDDFLFRYGVLGRFFDFLSRVTG
jgi:hypothetical protein